MQLLLMFLLLVITALHATWANQTTDFKRSVAPSVLSNMEHCTSVLRVFDEQLMSRQSLPAIGEGVRVFCMDLSVGSRWNWLMDKNGQYVYTHGYWGTQEVCDRRFWFRWFNIQDPTGATVNWYTSCKLTVWTQMCADQNDPKGSWVPQPAQNNEDDYHAFRMANEASFMTFAPAAITLNRPFFPLSRSAAFHRTFQREDVAKLMKC